MKRLSKSLKWLDDNILVILTIIFIFFIPLYPKLPLQMITYTYIAVRLEDIYVVLYVLIFFIQLVRRKVVLNQKFLWLFLAFWAAVFISFLYGAFLKKNLPYRQVAFLNAARRVEYMCIFFIGLAVTKDKKQLLTYLKYILIVLGLVGIYGVGQKFLGWPAVQTMNPEYAKGYLLFLTPEARISSTFAGQYDLGAYVVFLIPIVSAVYFYYKKSLRYLLLSVLTIFILVLTGSRSSFGAYVISTLLFLLMFKKYRFILILIVVTIGLNLVSNNLTSRLSRTFQVKQIFINQNTGAAIIPQKITAKQLPAGSFYLPLAQQVQNKVQATLQNQQVSANTEALVRQQIIAEVQQQASQSGKKLTSQEEDILVASLSAALRPITTVVSDISFATRLQVEWPRAIKAFLTNPVLGTGPSSITEATDNDYLRSLGEFGLLGTILFALIFLSIIRFIWIAGRKLKDEDKMLYYSFIFGLLGLFINAGYIDVFEASKVAFYFWLMAGFFVGSLLHYEKS